MTNEKLLDLHKKFFRPDNAVVIVTGTVDAKRVFQELDQTGEDFV